MKEFHRQKIVNYSCEQMFSIVSDVENYVNFIPFCRKSDVFNRKDQNHMQATLEIGYPPILQKFTSTVTLKKPHFIKAVSCDKHILDHLETIWKFSPIPESPEKTCIVTFDVCFQFKSAVLSGIAQMVFNRIVNQMEYAFLVEAGRRFSKKKKRNIKY